VQTAPDFRTVITEFFQFMGDVVQQHATATTTEIGHIVLVAHNGRVFDVPFLMRSLCWHNLQELWIDLRYGLTIDTLNLRKQSNKTAHEHEIGNHFPILDWKRNGEFSSGNE
jgi:DNA polymerase III alpha subunit (gram-positive type)